MCHDVVTILSCGCKHFEGVEFCHDAIFANEGQACPPEQRTPRRHIRWDSDPRDTRSCSGDPCPTQLARENDEKLQQVRDEVAMQYARGERRPNGGQLGRPGVSDEFDARAQAQSRGASHMEEGQDHGKDIDKLADLEGNDNDGYHYQYQGSYSAIPGATADMISEGKGKENSDDELGSGCEQVYDGPVSEKPEPKSARYPPPASAPIPIANPVTYPRKDSLDLGHDFDFQLDSDMVAIFGEGAGGPKRARSETGPPGFIAGKAQCPKGEMNKQGVGSLVDKVDRFHLGEKQDRRDIEMRLTGTCGNEGFPMSPGHRDTAHKEVGTSDQTIGTTDNQKGEEIEKTTGINEKEAANNKQRKRPERITIPAGGGRITPNLNNTPVTPSPTSSSKRSSRSQPWPSNSHTSVSKERESPRKSWVTKVINSGAPNMVVHPTFSKRTGLFSGGSPRSPRSPRTPQSSGFADLAVDMTVPSPVFAQPGREKEGQGHDNIVPGGEEGTENHQTSNMPRYITASTKMDCIPSPIKAPSKAVVRGIVRHFSTPDIKTPTCPGPSPEAVPATSGSVDKNSKMSATGNPTATRVLETGSPVRVTIGVSEKIDAPMSEN